MQSAEQPRLVLVRHGQSEANAANSFTGWSESPLTDKGRAEAAFVARQLVAAGLYLSRIFQSTLDRCAETVRIIVQALGASEIPIVADGALIERDYGALTGMNKGEAALRFGAEQVRAWRRSYAAAPPQGESLRDTAARVLAYHINTMLPAIMKGGVTLVVFHGNALRALVMAIDDLSGDEIERVDLSTGAAIVYTLDPSTAVPERAVLSS